MIVGSFLHFLFELSGCFFPLGTIAAVNESVWEHLKLGFWPVIFLSPIEYRYIKQRVNNFVLAKMVAAYTIPASIVILFYSYTAILGTHLLFMDILIFYLAVIIGHVLSLKIMLSPEKPQMISKISVILIISLAFLFVLFTFFPPRFPLFQDSLTGQYGIPKYSN